MNKDGDLNLNTLKLGECRIQSPMSGVKFVDDGEHVLYHDDLREIKALLDAGKEPACFEVAGPREKIFFDPSKLKCGIVTCGGLCPGLNDVIRAIVMGLHYHYGAQSIFGFRYGYEGLSPKYGHAPIELTPERVEDIHQKGGTILGSSRGPQDISEMVDMLERMNVGVLFTIGGPKTIDNDIAFVQQSFGFVTAVTETRTSIYAAHMEAWGARNGIGLVKLMGRHSGFIAAAATLANSDVNFCLVPEVTFTLDGLLEALRVRLERRHHAVILVGEGAGQDLLGQAQEKDASGNIRLGDIGLFLGDKIKQFCKENDIEATLKYIDPSYTIRSMPAGAFDSAFCLSLGYHAVHAAMAGRTNMVVGYWKNQFTHVPLPMAVSERKQIDPDGELWSMVRACTGQPREM